MKWKVLCVDDVASNLFTYESILSKVDDIDVLQADSGKEALDILLKEKIDLILLDIQMPGMDGYEVAKLVKSNNQTSFIPIIFITAVFKKDEFVHKGFSLGAVDYLTKPLDDNLLLNRIRLYLNIFSQRDLAKENMEMFYEIARSIGDGLYVLDAKHKVTFINKVALQMLGFKESDILGKEMHTITHYRDRDGNYRGSKDCIVHKALQDGEVITVDDDVFIKKDGTSIPVSVVATPIKSKLVPSGIVVLFRDITKQKRLFELESQKLKNEQEMIYTLVDMIDRRDAYTAGHTTRVATYCTLIAQYMGYSQEDIDKLSKAAHLHDIGKITTPDSILLKPDNLKDYEYEIIKLHLLNGYELLSQIDAYKDIAYIMQYHHERYDGKGYPYGLKGEQIPKLSRIMILSDAFDAMTTNRIYKKKKTVDEALKELDSLRNIQFHSEVVDAALEVLKDVEIDFSADQKPTNEVEEQRYAFYYKDRLTDLFTIEYLPMILDRNFKKDEKIFLYKIKLGNFNTYNLTFSWKDGDKLLVEFAENLKKHFQRNMLLRIEGDDFLLLSKSKIDIDIDKLKTPMFLKSSVLSLKVESKEIKKIDTIDIVDVVRKI